MLTRSQEWGCLAATIQGDLHSADSALPIGCVLQKGEKKSRRMRHCERKKNDENECATQELQCECSVVVVPVTLTLIPDNST